MKKYFFYLSMALVAFVVASCGLKGNHTSAVVRMNCWL